MLRVLVVDDEPQVVRLVSGVLAADDAAVVTAGSFAGALETLGTVEVDVAIVDKNLPDGSGLELIRQLKQKRPEAEAILITGYASLESAIEAVEVGAFEYVLKPFDDVHALRVKVRNAAERGRLRQVERQLLQAQKMEALGRLADSVAHDFNNLLCVILDGASSASELIASGAPAEEVRERLSAITTAVEQASRLTRQLLAFSRRPAGLPEVLDLNEVVTELATLLSRLVGDDRELEVSLEPGLPPIKIARAPLEQVLLSLVVNARGKNVMVGSSRAPGGVSLRMMESSGAGMDLAVVRGIVEAAGGTVAVESQAGGTTVRITLPASAEPVVRAERDKNAFPESVGETVLIADDDEGIRSLLSRHFTRAGYLVATARNAADATVKFQSLGGDVDLLVTDVIMPQMNGRELASRLRRVRPGLKVIYLSGHAPGELEEVGAKPTDGQLLFKPFSADELGRAVRHALGR
jgi:CheY-like chemotaxis protein